MKTEDEICRSYEAELAAIALLDRRYYLNPNPTRADRKEYATRQKQLEERRLRFYAELIDWQALFRQRHRCRSMVRRPKRREAHSRAD